MSRGPKLNKAIAAAILVVGALLVSHFRREEAAVPPVDPDRPLEADVRRCADVVEGLKIL